MRTLAALLSVFLVSGQVQVATGHNRQVGAAPCALTAPLHDWPVWGSGNTCAGGSACTNGAGIDTVVDVGSSPLNATQSTSGNRPQYVTSSINGLAAADYSVASTTDLTITTGVDPAPVSTWMAVIKPGSAGTIYPIVAGGGASLEWRITSGGKQQLLYESIRQIGVGTATLTPGSWTTLVAQFNTTNGVWALFICSGGTCSSDGSGTDSSASMGFVTEIGHANNGDGSFKTSIAEVAHWNTTTTSGIGAYSSCKYGL